MKVKGLKVAVGSAKDWLSLLAPKTLKDKRAKRKRRKGAADE